MPDRDRAAVHVRLRQIGAGVVRPRQHNRRERLVDLEQVDVGGQRQPGTLPLLGGRDDTRSACTAGPTPQPSPCGCGPVERRPSRLAVSEVVISTAALPSDSGEELPAVISHLICGKRAS